MRRVLTSAENIEPVIVFAVTRTLFLLLTYSSVILFGQVFQSAHPSMVHQLLPAWDHRWDTQWYLDIARRGYAWTRPGVDTRPAAFFPLYPLLIHVGVALTRRSYIVVALAISNGSFLLALLYLWRLARWEVNADVARRALLYVAVFPTAFFFFAGYTESLFLWLTIASFFHLRRREWLIAGIFAALASATRVTGILLVFPLIYDYGRDRNWTIRNVNWGITGLVLAPLGFLGFMAYLHGVVGDGLAFSHNQTAWQKISTPAIWSGFVESVRQVVLVQPAGSFFQAENLLNVVLGGFCLVLSILAWRRLPTSYGIYMFGFWLVTLTSPAMAHGYPVPLVSLGRYVVTLFPVFIYWAMVGERRSLHDLYMVISVGMLSLLTVLFIHGTWIV